MGWDVTGGVETFGDVRVETVGEAGVLGGDAAAAGGVVGWRGAGCAGGGRGDGAGGVEGEKCCLVDIS